VKWKDRPKKRAKRKERCSGSDEARVRPGHSFEALKSKREGSNPSRTVVGQMQDRTRGTRSTRWWDLSETIPSGLYESSLQPFA